LFNLLPSKEKKLKNNINITNSYIKQSEKDTRQFNSIYKANTNLCLKDEMKT